MRRLLTAVVLMLGAWGVWGRRRPTVTADSFIKPPRRIYDTFDPTLRDATTHKRQRVEFLQRQARRASAGRFPW